MLSATEGLPSSDDDLIAGWLRIADAGMPANGRADVSLVRSLARRRHEAAGHYELVLHQLCDAQ
jgi:hypothetical protein